MDVLGAWQGALLVRRAGRRRPHVRAPSAWRVWALLCEALVLFFVLPAPSEERPTAAAASLGADSATLAAPAAPARHGR